LVLFELKLLKRPKFEVDNIFAICCDVSQLLEKNEEERERERERERCSVQEIQFLLLDRDISTLQSDPTHLQHFL
jgi:hypothetical protein